MGVIGIHFNYRQILTAACTLIAVLVIVAPASASNCVGSSVTQEQYAENVDQFKSCNESGTGDPGDPGDPSAAGSLPFTGLDLGLMGGAAVVLLAGGVLLSRRARTEDEA